MFCTIGFSIVYALVVFTVLVGVIGPEGDKGSLRHMFKCTKNSRMNAHSPSDKVEVDEHGICLTDACYVTGKNAETHALQQEHL